VFHRAPRNDPLNQTRFAKSTQDPAERPANVRNPVSAAILFDSAATNIRIRNNILVGSDKFGMHMWNRPDWPQPESPPPRKVTHNLFYANTKQLTLGELPIQAAPFFLCPPKEIDDEADFGLRDDSPARDAGVDTARPRADGTAKDLGAYEHSLARWQAGIVVTPSSEKETMP